MKFKKIMLVTLLLLAILTISSVSASDNLTDDELQSDSSQEIEISNDNIVLSAQETDNGTFAELQSKIDNADVGSTVTLANNYTYEDGFDTEGIKITKSITIDGNGYTIDGNSQARAFFLNAEIMTIKNLTIINCRAPYEGGAIYNYVGPNSIIDSCTFINCYSDVGGAISNNGNVNMKVISCNFNKCSADENGGAIVNKGNGANSAVISCNFTDCHVKERGGAITNLCYNFTVESCNFNNCSTIVGKAGFAGAIENRCTDLNVISCNFTDCFAQYGGAIYNNDVAEYCYITSCNFNNCSSNFGGAIKNDDNVNCNVTSCIFINCSAVVSGAAIHNTASNCTATNCKFTNLNESEAGCNVTFIKCTFNYTPSTVLIASKVTATYGVSKKISFTLKDANGNALSNKNVAIKLGTISKTLNTDSNGQASVIVSSLLPKIYVALIKFEGDSHYTSSNHTVNVVVKKATPKIAAKKKTFKKSKKIKKYTITLKNNLNKVMKNVKVYIKVNKKTYTAKTNSKGKATFKITKLKKKGTFKAKIVYKGNSYYNKVTKKVNIKVK